MNTTTTESLILGLGDSLVSINGCSNAGGILNAGTSGVVIKAMTTEIAIIRNIFIAGAGTAVNGIRILARSTVNASLELGLA